MGATRDRYSLEYWCRRFDVESPKGSIDGSQVARVYRQGRIDDIGEYCLRDVRATAELIGVEGRTLSFRVEAQDEREPIGGGSHQRVVVNVARFDERVQRKLEIR